MLQEMRSEGGLTLLVCEAGLRSARGFQALCLWCAVAPALPWGAVLISCPDTLMPGSDEWGSSILSPSCPHDCRGQDVFQIHLQFQNFQLSEQLDMLLTFCVDISFPALFCLGLKLLDFNCFKQKLPCSSAYLFDGGSFSACGSIASLFHSVICRRNHNSYFSVK